MLTAFIPISAFNTLDLLTFNIEQSEKAPSYLKTVNHEADSYTVTYEFNSAAIIESSASPGSFNVAINGFVLNSIAGQPGFAQKLEKVLLPDVGNYTFEILEENYIEYDLVLAPAVPNVLANADERPAIKEIPISDSYFPCKTIEIIDEQIYRKQRFLNLFVRPVQYNSDKQKVRIYTYISYRLTFDSPMMVTQYVEDNNMSIPKLPMMQALENSTSGIIDPKDFIFDEYYVNYETDPYQIGYLIVSDVSLLEESMRFADWKRKMGYNVSVLYAKPAIAHELANYIIPACQQDSTIQYLLLVGRKTIPQCTAETGRVADMYYACLDGYGDITPDLYYGRIPADTPAEARAAFDKIMAYETGRDRMVGEESERVYMWNTFASISYFQSEIWPESGIEDYDFCYSNEIIAKAADSKFDSVSRMYIYDEGNEPKYWNSGYAGYDTKIPNYLLDGRIFSPNINYLDIISVFNRGASIILQHDHGQVDGWVMPEFKINHLDALLNTQYPIVFNIDCSVGDYTKDNCFAKKLLCQPIGGCATCIASTKPTWNRLTGIYKIAMFKSLWYESDINMKIEGYLDLCTQIDLPHSNTIGEMALAGILGREQYRNSSLDELSDRESFNVIGDPSLHVYWNNDIDIKEEITIKRTLNSLIIRVPDREGVLVSFSSPKRNFFKKGNDIFISIPLSENAAETYITIHYKGANPYCFYLSEIPLGLVIRDPITIINCAFKNNSIEVELDGELSDELSLEVISGTLTSVSNTVTKQVSSLNETIEMSPSTNNIYYVRLVQDGEMIDSKILYKK